MPDVTYQKRDSNYVVMYREHFNVFICRALHLSYSSLCSQNIVSSVQAVVIKPLSLL